MLVQAVSSEVNYCPEGLQSSPIIHEMVPKLNLPQNCWSPSKELELIQTQKRSKRFSNNRNSADRQTIAIISDEPTHKKKPLHLSSDLTVFVINGKPPPWTLTAIL